MLKGNLVSVFIIIALGIYSVAAQTTEFSHQGSLKVSGSPANGTFDFEFKLFDAVSGGTQQGPTNNIGNVAVVNGVYGVTLNFGAVPFNGGDRFLEISVRASGGGTFTPLTPRQKLLSTPYAIRSLSSANAVNAGTAVTFSGTLAGDIIGTQSSTTIAPNAVTAAKIATGEVVKSINTLKDNVTLAAGSNITITPSGNTLTIASTGGGGGGILNQTTTQAGANFSIDGTGTANILAATTQFNLGPNRILSNAGLDNLFVGWGAGAVNTGTVNSFFGRDAGAANTNGFGNSFFGSNAGESNTSASSNSFFGSASGRLNTTGNQNSFFGYAAGNANTTGSFNAFFGANAGLANTVGNTNVFLGSDAGIANTTGSSNVFIGASTGFANTLGNGNAFFGRSTGLSNTTGGNNAYFGTEAGLDGTTGSNNAFLGWRAGRSNVTGSFNTAIGDSADVNSGNLQNATAIGAGAIVGASNRVQLGRDGLDTVRVGTLGAAAATNLCISNNNVLAACTSSGKYKKNVQPLGGGLNLVNKLRPVTFDWKDRDEHDLGLVAEEVAKVDPLLVTRDRSGNIQGVKYDQLTVVLINAIKQQQELLNAQQRQIDELKKLVVRKYTSRRTVRRNK